MLAIFLRRRANNLNLKHRRIQKNLPMVNRRGSWSCDASAGISHLCGVPILAGCDAFRNGRGTRMTDHVQLSRWTVTTRWLKTDLVDTR